MAARARPVRPLISTERPVRRRGSARVSSGPLGTVWTLVPYEKANRAGLVLHASARLFKHPYTISFDAEAGSTYEIYTPSYNFVSWPLRSRVSAGARSNSGVTRVTSTFSGQHQFYRWSRRQLERLAKRVSGLWRHDLRVVRGRSRRGPHQSEITFRDRSKPSDREQRRVTYASALKSLPVSFFGISARGPRCSRCVALKSAGRPRGSGLPA
jgi:hypothetical protein